MATNKEKLIAMVFFGWYEKPDIREFFPVQEIPPGAKIKYPLDLLSEQSEHD